ncbi:MAG: hypothetical protein MN733_18480, partial [Nitrososphaera sp.]|nr:hypothetical protein [Nitrososphaera sp.]
MTDGILNLPKVRNEPSGVDQITPSAVKVLNFRQMAFLLRSVFQLTTGHRKLMFRILCLNLILALANAFTAYPVTYMTDAFKDGARPNAIVFTITMILLMFVIWELPRTLLPYVRDKWTRQLQPLLEKNLAMWGVRNAVMHPKIKRHDDAGPEIQPMIRGSRQPILDIMLGMTIDTAFIFCSIFVLGYVFFDAWEAASGVWIVLFTGVALYGIMTYWTGVHVSPGIDEKQGARRKAEEEENKTLKRLLSLNLETLMGHVTAQQ